jgi:predicted ATPase
MAPLTLLVGQNSVGKSSVFQAILSLAQWTASGTSATYPLNGDFVRLGKFSDVVTRGSDEHQTPNEICFGLQSGQGLLSLRISKYDNRSAGRVTYLGFSWAFGNFEFVDSGEAKLKVELKPTSVEWERGNGIPGPHREFGSYHFESQVPSSHLANLEGKSLFKELLDSSWELNGPLTLAVQSTLRQIVVAMSRASISYGRPLKLIPAEEYCRSLITLEMDHIHKFQAALLAEHTRILDRVEGRHAFSNAFDLMSKTEESNGDASGKSNSENFVYLYGVPDLGVPLERLSDPNLEEDFDISKRIWNDLFQLFSDKFGDSVWEIYKFEEGPSTIPWYSSALPIIDYEDYGLVQKTPVHELGEVIRDFEKFLHTKLSYLGPLRVNGFSSAFLGSLRNTIFPVGASGETTALLIMQQLDERATGEYPIHNQGIVNSDFKSALESWISLFTVPNAEVVVIDRDKNGIQIEISGRTLDQYGTGASQVLPILALILSRKPGDVVLIEQPELHLHPGGQQYLADFFMAATKLGIQVVLETHSEYMVNRIRRGVVFGHIQNEDVKIVNFEQEIDGTASVSSVGLNGSGGYADWPQGFFAQTEEDLLDIISALDER